MQGKKGKLIEKGLERIYIMDVFVRTPNRYLRYIYTTSLCVRKRLVEGKINAYRLYGRMSHCLNI